MSETRNDLPGIVAGKVFPDGTPRSYEARLRLDFESQLEAAAHWAREHRNDYSGVAVLENMRRARREMRAALARLESFAVHAAEMGLPPAEVARARKDLALVRDRLEWL